MEARPQDVPRVVALLAHSGHDGPDRYDVPEGVEWNGTSEGCSWGDEQAGRLRAWLDGGGGGRLLASPCPLADEGVGRALTELVLRRLVEKGVQHHEGRGECDSAAAEMTIGQYVEAFPHLRASDRETLAPPSALVPPEERRRTHGRREDQEVPYLSDFVLGRTEGGLALLHLLMEPSLPSLLVNWPSRLGLSIESPRSVLSDTDATAPFAHLFLGPRGVRSRVHQDDHSTHGWLIQLAGRKKVWLWPPHAFPYHKHTPREVILEPWHMLYIPFRWAHEVVALDDSLSVQWRYLCPQCPDAGEESTNMTGC